MVTNYNENLAINLHSYMWSWFNLQLPLINVQSHYMLFLIILLQFVLLL